MTPLVSIVMSVYNGERYLKQSVESVLGQSYRNFEFIVIDDASTDRSGKMLAGFADDRIKIITNPKNLGLTKSLVNGINASRGVYIARLDADDVAMPSRIEEQVDFMESHGAVGVCGSWAVDADDESRQISWVTGEERLKAFLLFDNVFIHSSVIIRAAVLTDHQINYDPEFRYAQDFDLWARLADVTRLAVLPKPLIRYRFDAKQISVTHGGEQKSFADRVRIRLVERLMQRTLNENERDIVTVNHSRVAGAGALVSFCNAMLTKTGTYDRRGLAEAIKKIFFRQFHRQPVSLSATLSVLPSDFLGPREKLYLAGKYLSHKFSGKG